MPGDNSQNLKEIRLRIRTELDGFGLNEEQVDKVIKYSEQSYFVKNGYQTNSKSHLFAFREKSQDVAKRLGKYGLTFEKYIKAALKKPTLFYMSADTVEKNINQIIEKFKDYGLTHQSYIKSTLKKPSIFTLSADTIEKNINEAVDKFKEYGLTHKNYIIAALKQPSLFTQSADTIEKNINEAVDKFKEYGVTHQNYIKAAIKQPSLFTQSANTIEKNITEAVDKFKEYGVTHQNYIKGALKEPTLFYRSADTIEKNINEVIEKFKNYRLNHKQYIKAGLKQPSLFTYSADTIYSNFIAATKLIEKGHLKFKDIPNEINAQRSELLNCFLKNPKFFNFSEENYKLREIYGEITLPKPSTRILYTFRKNIEAELTSALGHDNQKAPLQNIADHKEFAELRAKDKVKFNGSWEEYSLFKNLIENKYIKGTIEV